MPVEGEQVTVRALWPMPGTADQAVVTVAWGPQLAALVDAGRFELHRPPGPGGTAVEETTEPAGHGEPVAPVEAEGDDGRPGRRPRAR
jgi:hypothetical protein